MGQGKAIAAATAIHRMNGAPGRIPLTSFYITHYDEWCVVSGKIGGEQKMYDVSRDGVLFDVSGENPKEVCFQKPAPVRLPGSGQGSGVSV